ncbi:hypothetical protein DFQ10_105277 [Winogradskyella eximia]|uniref:Uncharacterized protein n=1 Tax=Winogradskyella eximia TaxID=262006 RepID=A0A3D9H2D1_9FLAO|nr:hypothetical protein [Winogradskyella eximia]RED43677.1 hypothetical protein DFQ10_105277 [Winogradskyella eximia]
MKDIISVGFYLPTKEDDFIELKSNESLSDADLVIFCPNFDNARFSYGHNSSYRGKTSYNLDDSSRIVESAKHWNRELEAYLKCGKNLYILLSPKYEFYIDTGQRRTSGTGRNQKVTNIVDLFSNYKLLPFDLKVHNASGKKMVLQNDLVKSFYKSFEKELTFQAYLEPSDKYTELIKTKSLDKLLSIKFQEFEGEVIVLPYIETDRTDFYNEDDEWNADALKFGKKLIHSLIEIDKNLSSQEVKSPKPDWLNNEVFELEKAEKTKKLIQKNQSNIEKIRQENQQLESVLKAEESIKDLLFETGKPLEIAVIKALELLGFEAENFDNGVLELDQVITSPEKLRYIGECEGKDNKTIDISKFRQLLDSLNEDFEREEIKEKAFGLLFGNPKRLIPLNERKEFFTQKCINGAEREKIGLIKTVDLFFIAQYLRNNLDKEFQKNCRDAIYNGLGNIIKFPEVPKK